MSFGSSTVEVQPPKEPKGPLDAMGRPPQVPVAANIVPHLAPIAGAFSPWADAKPDAQGKLILPTYSCELPGVDKEWTPGDYEDGVDNIEKNETGNNIKEWGGQRFNPGEREKPFWQQIASIYEEKPAITKVPHMPGQPIKEMFARLKAAEPRIFEDVDFLSIHRDLPEGWKKFVEYIHWSEGCGINTEQGADWKGHDTECLPAMYVSHREGVVVICVGIAQDAEEEGIQWAPGADYDFLEYLYAKDQDGNVIQIQPYKSMGLEKISFAQYSFVPPAGTSQITPYACFKLRGVWMGSPIPWSRDLENPDMAWFSERSVEERAALGLGVPRASAAERQKKSRKQLPKLWPENSWEGNAAKARFWDK